MSGPLQHSTWAGVSGWFIAVTEQKEKKWPIITVEFFLWLSFMIFMMFLPIVLSGL